MRAEQLPVPDNQRGAALGSPRNKGTLSFKMAPKWGQNTSESSKKKFNRIPLEVDTSLEVDTIVEVDTIGGKYLI